MWAIIRDITIAKQTKLELEKHKENLEDLIRKRTLALEETIQRLQETQSQLVQSEKLASLGILTAGIAHEINNPINYINASIVSLELLATELVDIIKIYETITPENIQEKLEEIKELKESINLSDAIEGVTVLSDNIKVGAKKTADIVKSLRIFSRSDSDIPALADINENLDSTLILLHNQYSDRIEIKKDYERLPLIKCFAGKLNQVFMNLLANAIQAIEEKGTITIKTHYIPSGIHGFKKECVFISILDTGSGIPLEIQNKVFEPFFTTKEIGNGTGLGLSISYGIIEQHKGKIEFTSSVDKGTEFKIYLPI
jgi:signal transduction histidine kinase